MLDPRRLCQIEIPVSDLGRALLFYADAFGWRSSPAELHDFVVLEVPDGCPFGLSLVRAKAASEASPTRHGPTIYFAVQDPEALVQAVLDAGGRKRFGPTRVAGYGMVFQVEDPDGNRFGLYAG